MTTPKRIFAFFTALCLAVLCACAPVISEVPRDDTGRLFVTVNDNVPCFDDVTDRAFEHYSELDALGRCRTATACIGQELMPTEKRESIGSVHPSGWHLVKYDHVDGKYLYNRCHLIAYQLTGENANEKNLITGTRAFNAEGMLPFEELVGDFVRETGYHVMYRVTPVFEGNNLVASGVEMEALSVEDEGDGVSFHVFVFNRQPGVEIDYATGDSRLSGEPAAQESEHGEVTYVLNKNTRKFHRPDCPSARDMKPQNKKEVSDSREELLQMGYQPCGECKP